MHAIAIVGYGVQEVKQDLRVSTHRAGDVAQRDKRRWSRDLAFAGDGQDFAALAETLPDGATQVRYRSKRIRTQPARSAKIEATVSSRTKTARSRKRWTMSRTGRRTQPAQRRR